MKIKFFQQLYTNQQFVDKCNESKYCMGGIYFSKCIYIGLKGRFFCIMFSYKAFFFFKILNYSQV